MLVRYIDALFLWCFEADPMENPRSVLGVNGATWPAVGAVVINWNNYEDTADCLDSLAEVDYPHLEIVVVDNGSDDGSLERLRSEYDCYFLANEENRGFAAANNWGIEYFLDADVNHVLLVNNDMVVTEDFLVHLVATAESSEDVAGVGGIVRYYGSDRIWSAGGRHQPYFARIRNFTDPLDDEPYETNFVSPALLLLTGSFLKRGHRLDDSYFFSVEDQQLAFDARKDGWRFLVDPRAVVYHKEGGSAGTRNTFRFYHFTWGRLHFVRRNLALPDKLVFLMFFLASRAIRFAQWTAAGRTDLIRATLLAVYDYTVGTDPRRPSQFD